MFTMMTDHRDDDCICFLSWQDEDEFADTRILDAYRQIRLNELREAAVKNRFGELVDIVKNDWIREVTDASVLCTVIVHLYEDSLVECQLVDEAMRALAPRFKYLKFLRIKSTHAIENWPEKNLPAIFIYADGVMKMQIVTLAHLYGKSMKAADLEWYLVEKGVITDSELDDNPRLSNPNASALKVSSSVFRHVSSNRDSDDDDNYEDDQGGCIVVTI